MPTAEPSDETEGARCPPGRGSIRSAAECERVPGRHNRDGFIIDSVALRAYARAGIKVVAIASAIPTVPMRWQNAGDRSKYSEPAALLDDNEVSILEVAYPPHLQVDLIRQAARKGHIAAVLAQKPLALSLTEARQAVDAMQQEGKVLAVNQNMRFDAAVRLAKQLIASGELAHARLDRDARRPSLAKLSPVTTSG